MTFLMIEKNTFRQKLGILFLFVLLFTFLFNPSLADARLVSPTTFTNPLINGPDPFMTYKDGYYYYLKTQGGVIDVWKMKSLTDIEHATVVRIWTAPTSGPKSKNIWAPELYFLDGKWYIYYAADDGNDINHRMYVLESTSADAQGTYIDKGKVYDRRNDTWAIDGTLFRHTDGKLYFLWSGRATNKLSQPQYIYIAPMSNPWTISGSRVAISKPTYSWEKVGGSVNEGPVVLQRNGKTFVTFSASFFNTLDYCLGMLTNTDGKFLTASSWVKKSTPVFAKTTGVFGPGHNAFTTSPDGTEDWLIYHGRNTTSTSEPRSTRAQKFTWNQDGTPNFGSPITANVEIPLPSGDVLGDLVIDRFVLTDVSGVEKTVFTQGEDIYPKVILRNQGGLGVETDTGYTYTHFYSNAPASLAPSTSTDVNVYLRNGEFNAEFSKEYGASPVGPNNTFYIAGQSWKIATAGAYTARVYANFDLDGIERNYDNNQQVVPYTIIPATASAAPIPTQ